MEIATRICCKCGEEMAPGAPYEEFDKHFFKAIVFDVLTNDNGDEKEIDYHILVCAKDVKDATEKTLEWIKQGYNMELKSISRTKFLDCLK